MLTTPQIERQLGSFDHVPKYETPHKRVERLKREMIHAVMHDYPGGVTMHLVEEFGLSKSVVQKEMNAAVENGKIVRKMVSRKTATTTITYATYRTNGG